MNKINEMLKEHIKEYISNGYVFDSVFGQVYHCADAFSPADERDYDTLTFVCPCIFDFKYTNEEKQYFINKILKQFPYLKRVAIKYNLIKE